MGDTLARLCALLPEAAEAIEARRDGIREIRLRAGRPPALRDDSGTLLADGVLPPERLGQILSALLEHSLHAREEELRQGFFTLSDGCRVGVCGQMVFSGDRLTAMGAVGSLCVRVARVVPGCADALLPLVEGRDGLSSLLLVSPPGMGKTTCLRELARRLFLEGRTVCVADERHELAACSRGRPTLDIGPCADVMDGGAKALTIPMMVRGMAPEVIAADEIGGPGDAEALLDARRCGAAVLATAHGSDVEAARRRPALRGILAQGVFDTIAVLGGRPGEIRAVHRIKP